ncbi:hypothetical protein JCM5350_004139, partial [Sporobolomyces pararoseus]
MKVTLLTLVAATAAVASAAPSGERRALNERFGGAYASVGEKDPASKRDMEARWGGVGGYYNANSAEDPAAKRD